MEIDGWDGIDEKGTRWEGEREDDDVQRSDF
jgi:hypothetical protein